MAAHKFWKAHLRRYRDPSAAVSPFPMELSEFQLFNGTTRLGSTLTPTANQAPTSGALSALKDDLTTVGVYWADTTTLPDYGVTLAWEFPDPVDVDGILLGHRTTAVRAVSSVMMVGTDTLVDSLILTQAATVVANPVRHTLRGSPNIRFVSAAKTLVMPLTDWVFTGLLRTFTPLDWSEFGGMGFVTDTVKTKGVSGNIPTHCKVRLLRDRDSKVVRETWTDPVTGVYTFDYVDASHTYTVIAIHPLGSFRAVIADRLTPGLMP